MFSFASSTCTCFVVAFSILITIPPSNAFLVPLAYRFSSSSALHGAVLELTDANFVQSVFSPNVDEDSPSLILVDCYATFCGPCKLMDPIMKQVADMYDDSSDDGILVCRYDIESNDSKQFKLDLALQGCTIQALPALILLNRRCNGKVLHHWTGLQSLESIQQGILPHLQVVTARKKMSKGIGTAVASSSPKGLIHLASSASWQNDESYMLVNPYC